MSLKGNIPERKRGKVNYFYVVVGIYLDFVAVSMIVEALNGMAADPKQQLLYAAALILISLPVWHGEWSAYKYGKEHINDPASWNDEEAAAAAAREAAEKQEEQGE